MHPQPKDAPAPVRARRKSLSPCPICSRFPDQCKGHTPEDWRQDLVPHLARTACRRHELTADETRHLNRAKRKALQPKAKVRFK
jgi:hypothetical protein